MSSKVRRSFSLITLILGGTILLLGVSSASIAQDRLNLTITKLKAGQSVFGVFSYNRDMLNARIL